jgi:hypothetical protein
MATLGLVLSGSELTPKTGNQQQPVPFEGFNIINQMEFNCGDFGDR